MRGLFNIVMRIVSSLLGVLMVCMGGVWILQGLDIAFKVGFMVGDKRWVAWGALLALVGVAQIVWSNTRQR
jgi:drug/metabolite transporter superfamily protein YnfA